MSDIVERTGIRALAQAQVKDKEVRDKLNKNLHFVPIQLGKLDIIELTLKDFFTFKPKEIGDIKQALEEAQEQYKLKIKSLFLSTPIYDTNTGEVDPEAKDADGNYFEYNKDGNKRQTYFRNIDKAYLSTIGKIEKENLNNLGDVKRAFINFVKARHRNKAIISETGQWLDISGQPLFQDSQGKPARLKTPCLVYHKILNDENILGVIYTSYYSAGSGLFTPFLNTFLRDEAKVFALQEKHIAELKELQKKIDVDISYKTGVDIGHLAGVTEVVRTVLQQKFVNLQQTLNEQLQRTDLTAEDRTAIQTVIGTINNYDAQLRKSATYGATVENAIRAVAGLTEAIEDVKTRFGLQIIFVIPQERKENSYKYGTLVETPLAAKLSALVLTLPRSPSYLQNKVTYKIVDAITGGKHKFKPDNKSKKFTFDVKSSKGSKQQTASVKNAKISVQVPSSISTKLPVSKKYKKIPVIAPSNSLISLENLLRLQLQQTVRQNMGTGDRRDILNLRSGRFANSVKIDRLTQSRDGTITAFYNYMRYPYATFSRGGDQERPFTRDPKLLIAGSIRQIAQQVTTQRMRAVLV